MSPVAPVQVQPDLSAKERNAERKLRGPILRKLAASVNEGVRAFGREAAYVADHLFSAAEVKAGKLDAYFATWTGYKPSTWKRYVQVARVLDEVEASMSAPIAAKVATWPQDGITLLSSLDEEQRAAMVKAAGTNPSTRTLEAVRDTIKPRNRNTPSAAEKTSKLAEKIRELVATQVGSDATLYIPLIAGAQMAQDHPGQDIAAAILFLSVNPAVAEVAEPA